MSDPNPNLNFDIGMHEGQDTEYYLKKGFLVIAIEANPVLAKAWAERFAEDVENGRLVICNKALSHEEGRILFFVCEEVTEWSSTSERLASRGKGVRRIDVACCSYLDLARQYGTPYYMKIDIEGADLAPIMGLSQVQVRPAFVSYEASSLEGAALLYALGYKKFKLVGQRGAPDLVQPSGAMEGAAVDHAFPLGASGPFGEETLGPWSDFNDCASDYAVYRHFRRGDKRYKSEWSDIHARSDRFMAMFEKAREAAAVPA